VGGRQQRASAGPGATFHRYRVSENRLSILSIEVSEARLRQQWKQDGSLPYLVCSVILYGLQHDRATCSVPVAELCTQYTIPCLKAEAPRPDSLNGLRFRLVLLQLKDAMPKTRSAAPRTLYLAGGNRRYFSTFCTGCAPAIIGTGERKGGKVFRQQPHRKFPRLSQQATSISTLLSVIHCLRAVIDYSSIPITHEALGHFINLLSLFPSVLYVLQQFLPPIPHRPQLFVEHSSFSSPYLCSDTLPLL
jgi:hypothetical protein